MNGNKAAGDSPTWKKSETNFATVAIHSGFKPTDEKHSQVVPPISLATTYEQDAPGKHRGFEYTRSANPTRNVLETTLAALDKGTHGMCFSSGLAATTNIISMLSAGDHVICVDDVYGGTGRLFRSMGKTIGLSVDFVDFTDAEELNKVLKRETRLIWVETPTNPTLKIIDIARVSEIAHKFSSEIIVVVDNTFLTSFFQRPLELGADMVVYSLTKYMNGHSDVLMGAVVTSREDLFTRLSFLQNALGAVPSPFDCYLVNRSLKTLHVRMPMHMHNALAVAKYLESHPKVERVLHPGLPSHRQHKLALKQSSGHSGLISFYLKTGAGNPSKLLQNLKIFTLAESLGGYESLAEIPSLMTHSSVPPELREKLGITDTLVRLSVGLETDTDLIHDLKQGLESC